MTSTISCQTCKNNAPTTSSLPIITQGTHEVTASPPPPHAATARCRTPLRTLPSSPLPPRHCLLHVAFAVVCCMLPPPSFAACRRKPLRTPPLSPLPPRRHSLRVVPQSFTALRQGGGSSQQLSSQSYRIILYYKLSRQST